MDLWLATLLAILVLVAIGTVAARRWRPERPVHDMRSVLVARLVVILAVTALIIVARLADGAVAAAVTGVIGVLVAVIVLVATGYARIPPIRRAH